MDIDSDELLENAPVATTVQPDGIDAEDGCGGAHDPAGCDPETMRQDAAKGAPRASSIWVALQL